MSDAPSATPGTIESGPVSGTPPAADVSTSAPAAFSSEAPAAVEVAPAEPASSVLSDARGEAADLAAATETPPEPAAEAAPEAPAEVPAPEPAKPDEVKAEEVAPPEPAEPPPFPTYEDFALPEGVEVDKERLGTFAHMLGEFEQKIATDPTTAHAAAQELGQKLVNFYSDQLRTAHEQLAQQQVETWNRTREQWVDEFRNDPQIGRNRQETTLRRMGALMDLYGTHAGGESLQQVRDAFTATGAGDHPAVLRFVNWAAGRLVEAPRPIAAPPVVRKAPQTPSQRLYRNSLPGAA